MFLNKVTQAELVRCTALYENPKTHWEKLGTYSPTNTVAQPRGVKGKKSINR